MAIIIKKFSRKTIFSIAMVFGAFLAFASRLFFGSGHINLSKLSSSEKNPLSGEKFYLVHSVEADTFVDPGCAGCGTDGGSGDGAGGGGGDGCA